MHFIRTQGLTITTDRVLLHSVSLTIHGRTGILGDNGSGKSTLLRALASSPLVHRSAPVSLLTQEPDRKGTVADYLGVARTLEILGRAECGQAKPEELELEPEDWTLRERLKHAFKEAGLRLYPERRLSTLSGGEMARLGIAALALKPGILLLDEPTNHLDLASRHSFYEFVENFSGTLVIASHDRRLLRRMETIVELRPPEARVYGGSYDFYAEARAEEIAAEQSALRCAGRVLQKALREREDTLAKQSERQRQGRLRAPKAGMPRVLLGKRKRRAEQTQGRLAAVHDDRVDAAMRSLTEAKSRARMRRTVHIRPAGVEAEGLCARANKVNVSLDGGQVFRNSLTFSIRRKDRLWLTGDNGSGKSTLAALLMGFLEPSTGSIRRPVHTALLNQQGELWFARPDSERAGLPVSSLPPRTSGRLEMSAGERMHAKLRQALESDAALILLDEPTNHLDLERTRALAASLREYRGALIVITHDADFAEEAGLTQEFSLSSDSVDASA